jgi:DNA repair protein RecO (recombination protein O)
MRSVSAKCIILGHRNLNDFDKLIFLYNEDRGKIKAIAKGARRISSKFTGHLETLNTANCVLYFGPKNTLITEIETDEQSHRIAGGLDKLSGALQIAEITNQVLFENQSLDDLPRLIEKTILHLTTTKKPTLISIAYIIKLLDKVGIIPDFKTIESPLEEKYLKFFHYLKTESLTKIEKISLTNEETFRIKTIVRQIVQRETERELSTLLI